MRFDYDLFVMGAGPGRLAASEQAAGYGVRVAIAELIKQNTGYCFSQLLSRE